MKKIEYSRPVEATLHVHLANGEIFEAKPEDLAKFNLVDRHEAYMTFDDAWSKILRRAGLVQGDITNAVLNPIRYLVETAIANPALLDLEEHDEWTEVAECERLVQDALGPGVDIRDYLEEQREQVRQAQLDEKA